MNNLSSTYMNNNSQTYLNYNPKQNDKSKSDKLSDNPLHGLKLKMVILIVFITFTLLISIILSGRVMADEPGGSSWQVFAGLSFAMYAAMIIAVGVIFGKGKLLNSFDKYEKLLKKASNNNVNIQNGIPQQYNPNTPNDYSPSNNYQPSQQQQQQQSPPQRYMDMI
jgi:hypothetical protein